MPFSSITYSIAKNLFATIIVSKKKQALIIPPSLPTFALLVSLSTILTVS